VASRGNSEDGKAIGSPTAPWVCGPCPCPRSPIMGTELHVEGTWLEASDGEHNRDVLRWDWGKGALIAVAGQEKPQGTRK